MRQMTWLGYVDHLALIVCSISNEEWVQREKYPNYINLPVKKPYCPKKVFVNMYVCMYVCIYITSNSESKLTILI